LIEGFEPEKRDGHTEMIKEALPDKFIQEDEDISDDLFYNNPIFRCFDELKKK
jgi:hypothetical protein